MFRSDSCPKTHIPAGELTCGTWKADQPIARGVGDTPPTRSKPCGPCNGERREMGGRPALFLPFVNCSIDGFRELALVVVGTSCLLYGQNHRQLEVPQRHVARHPL